MITAQQARELQTQSDAEMQKRLEAIEKLIIQEATLGKNFASLSGFQRDPVMVLELGSYKRHWELTPAQKILTEKLRQYGFELKVTVREYDRNDQRGSFGNQFDDGERKPVEMVRDFGFEVRW